MSQNVKSFDYFFNQESGHLLTPVIANTFQKF